MINNEDQERLNREAFEVLWGKQCSARRLSTQKLQFSDAGERKQLMNSCREAAFKIFEHARSEAKKREDELIEDLRWVDENMAALTGSDESKFEEIKKKHKLGE